MQLLTAVPVPYSSSIGPNHQRWAAAWLPLVGLGLGGLVFGVDLLLRPVLPVGPRSALVLLTMAFATRFLHIDGLMDTFDGAFALVDRARRLEIMRDPHVGAFGVGAALLAVLVKFSMLAAVPDTSRMAILLLSPMVGRWAAVQAIAIWPKAREAGLGFRYAGGNRTAILVAASTLTLAAAYFVGSWEGLIAMGVATVVGLIVAVLLFLRFGGLTGDCYGTIVEFGEIACAASILGAATLANSGA